MDFPESPTEPEHDSDDLRYEYVTVADEDGSWSLEAKHRASGTDGLSQDRRRRSTGGSSIEEETNFENFVDALYAQNYSFNNTNQFLGVFNFADFYLALPAFSNSLAKALRSSPLFLQQIRTNADRLIIAAQRIQNKEFFRECFVHVISLWDPNKVNSVFINHPRLLATLQRGHNRLISKLSEAARSILAAGNADAEIKTAVFKVLEKYPWERGEAIYERAPLYRALWKSIDRKCECQWRTAEVLNARVLLLSLLGKNLTYDQWDDVVGKKGLFLNCFLSAELMELEYPW